MGKVLSFFEQSYLSFKIFFGWLQPKEYIMVKIINPVFQMVFFCLIAKYVYKVDDLTFYVIGNSVLLCVYNCIFGVGVNFATDRFYGTLKCIVASPTSNVKILFERSFIHIFDSLTSVLIGILVGSILFSVNFENINMIYLIITILLSMFSAVSFGMFISVFGLVTTNMNILINLSIMALIALVGVNIPIENLPVLLQEISNILPVTRSVQICDLMLANEWTNQIFRLMIEEFFIGTVYMLIASLFIDRFEKVAVRNATFDLY